LRPPGPSAPVEPRAGAVYRPFGGSMLISFHRILTRYNGLWGVLELDDGTSLNVVMHRPFLDVRQGADRFLIGGEGSPGWRRRAHRNLSNIWET
jgi:hypothetical protein